MMTVAAGYEGSYQNLTRFLNLLDKSPRFLIVESLQATPPQAGAVLNVMLKFNAFVREDALLLSRGGKAAVTP
jgi:type IV pilus assembly protein PilO